MLVAASSSECESDIVGARVFEEMFGLKGASRARVSYARLDVIVITSIARCCQKHDDSGQSKTAQPSVQERYRTVSVDLLL